MRIVVLADIHGNLPAFEAVVDVLPKLSADRMVILGDVVNGAPDSYACWQLAQSLNCPMIMGNHEGYVAQFGTDDHDDKWSSERFGPLLWTMEHLSETDIEQIRALPPTYQFSDLPELLFVHASVRSDRDTILGYTPHEELEPMFPGVTAKWILRGHNHVCAARFWGKRVIVTSGSIGLPLDGRTKAQFLVLDQAGDDWAIQHQAVPYDVDAALKRFHTTGYLDSAGPMARIYMREVATGGHTLVSFMHLYQKWTEQEDISLGDAVDRYFTMC